MAGDATQSYGRPTTPSKDRGLPSALGWTILSTAVPGLAHLRAGRRGLGFFLLTCFLLLVAGIAALAWWALAGDGLLELRRIALEEPQLVLGAGIALLVGALVWVGIIVHSFLVIRPRRLRWPGAALSVVVVAALCVGVAVPAGAAASYAYAQYELVNSLFGDPEDAEFAWGGSPNPWGEQERVNVLLLGGDAGSNRYGVRPDTTIVASIDLRTGNTVLLQIPRNLENVRFPPGSPLAEQFPYGFDQIFNEIYQFVADNPQTASTEARAADDPAAATLKEVVGYLLDLEIDYYAMVDMQGFVELIDAMGGVRITIEEPIVYGRYNEGLLEAGTRTLTGEEAMWYSRARTYSDDYTRMGRQGCVIQAVVEQAEPADLLLRFQELASVARSRVATDVPRNHVDDLLGLSETVRGGEMTTVQFTPPQIEPWAADWLKIRLMTHTALEESGATEAASDTGAEPAEQAEPSREPSAPAEPETGTEPEPAASPSSAGRQQGDGPGELGALCP
ncbi:LCP family protein [Allonocardiopsis opalescens]|uniref:LytR family transcriptional attenuator n=1 Tax=Allonocardiopsis opalescens TaxID=1144618 RepID=A0A2T0Q4G5_9ACTN|nr:LCP family protein [Allonocardiopsis opalescens]PRX98696.1 LytR family transcriptional attenuator [Allonocardiopsis opalescens]